ncbi:MAG TPA: molybdopterin molybdenumtransferase MoeA [Bacteroidales bacterium]|jgi:molybdopterin molybdotransferase|nr:molybdopterin molybdenumtransferase MoeA [Bacteroidales bacterium]HBZ22564.1 molybdopterin molybdenumtransferase MoeA [Bacteroidales bacterium]
MEMISFEKAFETVMNTSFRTGTETVSYTDTLNRILAEEIASDMDMPPFNKSSVDGFACRKSDLGNDLEILETIPAGNWPSKFIGKNQCSRIMTGAPVPDGADCVIMVEDTELLSEGFIKFRSSFIKENIAKKGEDIRKGELVLRAGKRIRPQDIAVMASVGHTSVTISKRPRVAVISSGSELVEPDLIPGMSQIRNSNASQLMAQIERAGASGKYYGIAADDEAQTLSIIEKAIPENDMVLLTGGVSMGDFDFVPSVLEQAGVRFFFTRVAVQPGKPTTFGLHSRSVIFGLPGNPVSSFIQFEMLVRPLLSIMMGCEWKPLNINMPMGEKFMRSSVDRMAFIPVKIADDASVLPVEYHGSAHISALPEADGIISMPVGKKIFEKGEVVSVRPI